MRGVDKKTHQEDGLKRIKIGGAAAPGASR